METLVQEYMQRNDTLLQSQATSTKNMELQMGQLANDIYGRQKGTIPSNTEIPNHGGSLAKEKWQVVTSRKGRNLSIPKLESERRNSTSIFVVENGGSSNNSHFFNSSLANDNFSCRLKAC